MNDTRWPQHSDGWLAQSAGRSVSFPRAPAKLVALGIALGTGCTDSHCNTKGLALLCTGSYLIIRPVHKSIAEMYCEAQHVMPEPQNMDLCLSVYVLI